MARTEQYKRRVPTELQGVVVDGIKLGTAVYVPLRDGMTRNKAKVFTDDLFASARQRVNYRLTDADAFEIAVAINDAASRMPEEERRAEWGLFNGGIPDATRWLERLGRTFIGPDFRKVGEWVERVYLQRYRLQQIQWLIEADDPEAMLGKPKVEPRSLAHTPTALATSIRGAVGRTPLHSDVTRAYFAAKPRPANYRRALEQFREQCGDLEVGQYTADHCWKFRNWLTTTLDEKRGLLLSGQTKNNKMSAVSSMFGFAIEARHRNDNPMRDVKFYPKNENQKKHRRLYTKGELTALFVNGQREEEWQFWAPLIAIFAGVRLRESIQFRPSDISDQFGVWHFLVQPGRGQRVKGGQARVVPVHRELIRLGLLDLHKRALRERREWLFRDVPLVEKPGAEFNAPEVETLMVPSVNAATQWFGRYSDDCGVRDPNVDFHALRGAWITYGSQQGRDLSLRMELAGHSKGSGVHQRYIYAGSSLKSLKAEIDKITYPVKVARWRF